MIFPLEICAHQVSTLCVKFLKLSTVNSPKKKLDSWSLRGSWNQSLHKFSCRRKARGTRNLMQIKDSAAAGCESARIGDRLSRLMTEMTAAQGEILGLEAQLAAAAAVETALTKEKIKSEKLERIVDELKETNLQLRAAATNREEEIQNLEKSLVEKDALVERLNLELGHTKELNIAEMKKLKEQMELQETQNRDQSRYISLLETEVKQLMGESGKARDEVATLNHNIAKLKAELDEIKSQADRILEAEVENALLKVELHKWRSKAAAAEAAEERYKSEIFALNRALQLAASSHQQPSSRNRFLVESEHKKQGKIDDINNVTISRKEYEEKVGKLERELMTATNKIREMRTRAEQAISRAEAAEKAKAELEDKIKRRKEKEKQKKEIFKNLREQIDSSSIEAAESPDFAVINTPAIQTLSNVLEIPL
ncbi:PREDICTED: RB1-inducible coiled-coil protein 1-like isoform X1 [Ipomoea nil]|uniref:RB1-inducible coiled-coil protein 1-like isoform X1 n=1 Tax=Ipomoea nil TaxID=35883 RepID=UPI0009019774|nr:PREDICTED: RB1-inducible coiled-coil protein 1-like isoform X1 [Ipomoea nil]